MVPELLMTKFLPDPKPKDRKGGAPPPKPAKPAKPVRKSPSKVTETGKVFPGSF